MSDCLYTRPRRDGVSILTTNTIQHTVDEAHSLMRVYTKPWLGAVFSNFSDIEFVQRRSGERFSTGCVTQ